MFTAIAFSLFAEENTEIAVVEVKCVNLTFFSMIVVLIFSTFSVLSAVVGV